MNATIDISGVALSTERLLLRPWRESDLEDFYAYARVDGVGQMAGWAPHRSLDESREILKLFIAERKTLALEYRGRAVGSLGIECYDERYFPELDALRGREIGYALSKEYWGQGLMPEAVKAVTDYLFDAVKLDFILVGHFEWNRQSARVIEKCGFAEVRTIPYQTRMGTLERSVESILYNPGNYSVAPGRTPSVWPNGQPAPSEREPIRRICTPKASLLEGGGPRSGSEGVRD